MWSSRGLITRSIMFLVLASALSMFGGAHAKLDKLTEDTWRDMLKGEWMVEFFAPWCPACRALQPTWEEFSTWADDLEINIGQVDVTESPGLSGRFMVTALPTIYHVKDGVFRQYRGARDKDSFITYVEQKKWSSVEPLSDWKSPDSIPMSMVSYFFKLSMMLRNVHTTLTETYELPSWGSYLIFALVTIALGGILGLLMVCCMDCLWPPSTEDFTRVAAAAAGDSKKDSDIEEKDDDTEEGEDSQEDDDEDTELSQDEGEDSQQEDGSQEEDDEEEEGSQEEGETFRGDADENKARRRKPRKAD